METIFTSNKKFGMLFTVVFLLLSIFFYLKQIYVTSVIFILISSVIFFLALFFNKFLTPLYNLWMKFGLILGKVVSPVVMGFIYFFVISPIAIMMKLLGRDELRLKKAQRSSYWQKRAYKRHFSFKNQF